MLLTGVTAQQVRARRLTVNVLGTKPGDGVPVIFARQRQLGALDGLQVGSAHPVGWSMGGGVALQVLLDWPESVRSGTLVAPVSPYGFGGTTGPGGALISADGAPSGAGEANLARC